MVKKNIENLNWEQIYSDLLDLSGSNQYLKVSVDSNYHIATMLSGDELYEQVQKTTVLLNRDESREKQNKIILDIDKVGYDEKLSTIAMRAKMSMQEQAVNILYLSFGILNWHDEAGNVFRSPLLVLPVMFESRSIGDNYKISPLSQTLTANITLAARFKQADINIDLPEFLQEDSIDNYIETVARKIKMETWNIERTCYIGLFAYSKLQIYKDIKDNEEQIRNHFFFRALSGDSSGISTIDAGKLSDTDREFVAKEVYLVADADSSQQKAILAAKNNNSFVIKGPPGTGKSQTITNIIAQNLGMGKTVLFVAQKEAALEVVRRNLDRAKLGDFCLPLYTAKVKKQIAINSMLESLKMDASKLRSECYDDLERLDEIRKEINEYVGWLHKKEYFGEKSLIDYLNEYVLRMDAKKVRYKLTKDDLTTPKELKQREELFDRYASQCEKMGMYDYRKSVFFGIKPFKATITALEEIKDTFCAIKRICTELLGQKKAIMDMLGMEEDSTIDVQLKLPELVSSLEKATIIHSEWLNSERIAKIHEAAGVAKSKCKARQEAKEFLAGKVRDDLTSIDLEFYPIIKKTDSKNLKILKQYILDKKSVKTNLEKIINCYRRIREIDAYFAANAAMLTAVFGSEYEGMNSDFEALAGKATSAGKVIEVLGDKLSTMLVDRLEKGFKLSISERSLVDSYSNNLKLLDAEIVKLQAYFDEEVKSLRRMTLKGMIDITDTSTISTDKIQQYNEVQKTLESLENAKIRAFMDAELDEEIPLKELKDTYLKAYYTQVIDEISCSDRWHPLYNGTDHEKAIQEFVELEHKHKVISLASIRETMSRNRPIAEGASRLSEVGILLSQAVGTPKSLKDIIRLTKRLLLRIKPCFLMSPLSVSSYLPPDMIFDVVIFDEASQICPGDAINAIYRSKQVIIVGDSQQLPPTSFFKRMDDSGSDDEVFVLGNSILDTGESILESVQLNWHYRSRAEELIAVSNRFVYGDQLSTFPSSRPVAKDEGLEFYFLENAVYGDREAARPLDNFGTFSKTSRAINLDEADKVVELVHQHIQKHPDRSLGVVTFSFAQQAAVQTAIDKFRRENKAFEKFFDATKDEPFFIKNLENVQGDERDTIIISICYGRDFAGVLAQNFGPINRDGGYKRLNVAITRSRVNLKVVSSIRGEDIVATEDKSKGVKMLKTFLTFADRKELPKEVSLFKSTPQHSLNYIADDLARKLTEAGYTVERDIGLSNSKIDLVVRMEDDNDFHGYMLGIFFDHESYARIKSATDRDRLRHEVLSMRGWWLTNIFSTEYYINPDKEFERIIKLLERNKAIFFKKRGQEKREFELSRIEEGWLVEKERVIDYNPITYAKAVAEAKLHTNFDALNREEKFRQIITEFTTNYGVMSIDLLFEKLPSFFNIDSVTMGMKEEVMRLFATNTLKAAFVFEGRLVVPKNLPICFRRLPDGMKRRLTDIYIGEIENGILSAVRNNIGIPFEAVRGGIIGQCNLTESELTDSENDILSATFENLISKKLIKEEGGMLYSL